MRFRDMPREELPAPTRCTTIGKGENERALTYDSNSNRRARRVQGRYARTSRVPGVAIPHEFQPWRVA